MMGWTRNGKRDRHNTSSAASQNGAHTLNKDSELGDTREEQVARRLSLPEATPAAIAMHKNFVASVEALKRDLLRSVHYLQAIHAHKIHKALGYKTIHTYAAEVAGFSGAQTDAFLALGRNLHRFPETKKALAEGSLSWSKARLIVTKATPEDERRWLEAARGLAVGRLRVALTTDSRDVLGEDNGGPTAATSPGAANPRPDSADNEDPSGGNRGAATSSGPNSEAVPPGRGCATPSHRSGAPGPGPAPQRQVAPDADRPQVVRYSFDAASFARWETLSATLRSRYPDRAAADLLVAALEALIANDIDPAAPSAVIVISECPVCQAAAFVTNRGRLPVPRPLLASAHCDGVVQRPDGTRRATIPPRLRRRVLARDGHRCQAPGCRHTRHLQLHHRVPTAQGGTTTEDNLVTLCAGCHRSLHRREQALRCAGEDPCR